MTTPQEFDDIMRPALLQSMKAMLWTTAPPTEPGWYWTLGKARWEEVPSLRVLQVTFSQRDTIELEDSGIWSGYDKEQELTVGDVTHWLGPLPVPAPPVDANGI